MAKKKGTKATKAANAQANADAPKAANKSGAKKTRVKSSFWTRATGTLERGVVIGSTVLAILKGIPTFDESKHLEEEE